MQRHGDGVALGGEVEGPLRVEERLEVGRGAGVGIRSARPGEREVVENEVLLLVGAEGHDAEVVGLDVAVRHADLLEVAHRFEQVVAPTLQELGADGAVLAQHIGEGPLAGEGQDEGGPLRQLHLLDELDDVGLIEVDETCALGADAVVAGAAEGDLEHHVTVMGQVPAPQRRGGGALAEAAHDLEAPGEGVAGLCEQRVDTVLEPFAGHRRTRHRQRGGDVGHALVAVRHDRGGAATHDRFECGVDLGHDRGERQPVLAERGAQPCTIGGGRLPGDE